MEERDGDANSKEEYNSEKKVNWQTVTVKLMTNSLYPVIFNDRHEAESVKKFKDTFEG